LQIFFLLALVSGERSFLSARFYLVMVEDLSSGRILKDANGIELIWQHIPAYAPFRLLLQSAALRRFVEQYVSGCVGDAYSSAVTNSKSDEKPTIQADN
jgi:hypothetical protein